jgi:hypothetical protein
MKGCDPRLLNSYRAMLVCRWGTDRRAASAARRALLTTHCRHFCRRCGAAPPQPSVRRGRPRRRGPPVRQRSSSAWPCPAPRVLLRHRDIAHSTHVELADGDGATVARCDLKPCLPVSKTMRRLHLAWQLRPILVRRRRTLAVRETELLGLHPVGETPKLETGLAERGIAPASSEDV